jgi:hypothetical protein
MDQQNTDSNITCKDGLTDHYAATLVGSRPSIWDCLWIQRVCGIQRRQSQEVVKKRGITSDHQFATRQRATPVPINRSGDKLPLHH